MFRSKFLGLAGVALVAVVSTAEADVVKTTGYSFSQGKTVGYVIENPDGTNYKSGNVSAGLFTWTLHSESANAVFNQNGKFYSFCIEILQTAVPASTFEIISLDLAPNPGLPYPGADGMLEAKANRIKQLWALKVDDFFDEDFLWKGTGNDAAAFQVAIWNIVYDTDNTVSNTPAAPAGTNTFYLTSNDAVRDLANEWLGQLAALPASADKAPLIALSSPWGGVTGNIQDQVVFDPILGKTNDPPVPTPMAAGMGLIGFSIIGLRRQRPAKA